ncbi:MAG TPA: DoxX family protein [Rhodothermales bacterium]|nr:DoxX family protein [Rhodothermales bacterium]
MLRNLLFGGDGGASPRADLGLLLLRVGFGLALALGHGLGKLPPSARFVEGVGEMGFPLPGLFAWLAAFAEFGGGLLLVFGLATRPAAGLVAINMLVAYFLSHGGAFGEGEKALLFALAALTLLIIGAGRYSVDALLRRPRGAYVDRYRNY